MLNKSKEQISSKIKNIVISKEFKAFLGLATLIAFLAIFTNTFMRYENIMNVLRSTAINGVIAVGVTFVILTGGIDLSVGSILALSGVLSVGLYSTTGSSPLAALSCVMIGSILGTANGFLIAKFNVPPFIVTLVMMTVARGLTYMYTAGVPMPYVGSFVNFMGRGYILGVPMAVIIFAMVCLFSHLLLKKTIFGRYIYAIGGNEECALLSGVKVFKNKMLAYTLSGMCVGIATIILIGRLDSAQPAMGDGYELDAVASVVIGGTSLSGGSGSILGTVFGALIIGVLQNGMNMLNVESFAQYVVKGIVILGAVLLDSKKKN